MGQISEYSREDLQCMGGLVPDFDRQYRELMVVAIDSLYRQIMGTPVSFWHPSLRVWTCALCDEENTGETCATSWCRLTPAQSEIAAGWFACVECGCGHPDITNGGERCPCCKEGEDPELAYWYALEDLRAGRFT